MSVNRRIDTVGRTVWTKGSTTAALFHPSIGPMRTAGMKYVRFSRWELRGDTGDIEVAPAFQVAGDDDESLWASATAVAVGSYQSGDAVTTNTSFTDISASLTARLVRFGWLARNKSGTDIHQCRVGGNADLREG